MCWMPSQATAGPAPPSAHSTEIPGEPKVPQYTGQSGAEPVEWQALQRLHRGSCPSPRAETIIKHEHFSAPAAPLLPQLVASRWEGRQAAPGTHRRTALSTGDRCSPTKIYSQHSTAQQAEGFASDVTDCKSISSLQSGGRKILFFPSPKQKSCRPSCPQLASLC